MERGAPQCHAAQLARYSVVARIEIVANLHWGDGAQTAIVVAHRRWENVLVNLPRLEALATCDINKIEIIVFLNHQSHAVGE